MLRVRAYIGTIPRGEEVTSWGVRMESGKEYSSEASGESENETVLLAAMGAVVNGITQPCLITVYSQDNEMHKCLMKGKKEESPGWKVISDIVHNVGHDIRFCAVPSDIGNMKLIAARRLARQTPTEEVELCS